LDARPVGLRANAGCDVPSSGDRRGGMDEPEVKIIDVFIFKLRKKLANVSMGQNYIETIWGRGYVLRVPTENVAKISA
jgi:two-component system, cell cycle response regulator CtrA